jgi:hypothetical protein
MKRDYPERPIIGVGQSHQSISFLLAIRSGERSVPGGALNWAKLRGGASRRLEETGFRSAGEVRVFDSIFTDPDGRTQYHYVLIIPLPPTVRRSRGRKRRQRREVGHGARPRRTASARLHRECGSQGIGSGQPCGLNMHQPARWLELLMSIRC